MSRNDIDVILVTAGPEYRVNNFCADMLDMELYVCERCTESNPCPDFGFHVGDELSVSRVAMAQCFAHAPFFTDEESAVRYANKPGMDEYDVAQYGFMFVRQIDIEFPWELLVSTA